MSGVHFNKVSGRKPYWLIYIIALKNFVIPLFMPFNFLPCQRNKRVLSAKVYRLNLENFKKSESYLEEFALIIQFSLIDFSCCHLLWQMSFQWGSQKLLQRLVSHELTAYLSIFNLSKLNELWPYQKHVNQIILNRTTL